MISGEGNVGKPFEKIQNGQIRKFSGEFDKTFALAITGLVAGIPFRIVREYSDRTLAGQFYSKAKTTDAWVASYSLAWVAEGQDGDPRVASVKAGRYTWDMR